MIHDFLVIGGGISGASAGYELAEEGSVLLLEAEASPGYHSTGRSAALFTRNYGGPVVRRINGHSQLFFRNPPEGFCEHKLLTPRGALTVSAPGGESLLSPLLAMSAPDDEIVTISPEDALRMVPFLRPERLGSAVYEKNVSDIDVAHLHQSYLKGFKSRGGKLMNRQPVTALDHVSGHWRVATPSDVFEAKVLINAAGAWAGQMGAMAGAMDIALVPKRRTGIVIDAPEGIDVASLPLTDFTGSNAYIKPEAGRLMASPGDATPSPAQDARPDEMDIAVLADWIQRETTIEVRSIAHSWAGLRSFVRDEAPVVGFDPLAPDFFWLAGQGGYGIMMAPTLAQMTAGLCLSGALPAALAESGIDPIALSPERLH